MVKPETLIRRAAADDPDRCQAGGSGGEGQCHNLSVKGMVKLGLLENITDITLANDATNCSKHGGLQQVKQEAKTRLHDYRIQAFQERLDEYTESDNVKSLRGEIAVLRLLMQTFLEKCKDGDDLILYSFKLSALAKELQTLVTSCERLESRSSAMLDKASGLILAGEIVKIISSEIPNPEVIDRISHQLIDAIKRATGGTDA